MKWLNRFSIYLIMLSPFIDVIYTINRFYLGISFPVQQIIRGFILLAVLYYLYKFNRYKVVLITIIILAINELIYLVNGSVVNFMEDFSYIIKIIYTFSIVYFYYSLLEQKIITKISILKSLQSSSVIISIIIILSSITNTGLNTYGNSSLRFGVKGLFYAQNSITATLLMLLPICILISIKERNIYNCISALFNIVALNLIGTKMGLVGSVLIVIIFAIFCFTAIIKKELLSKKTIIIMSISILALMVIFLVVFKGKFINIYNGQRYIYRKYRYNSIFTYMVSNRDLQIHFLRKYVNSSRLNLKSFLIGLGYSKANLIINLGKKEFKMVEMDFVGVYYYSGIFITLILIYIIYKALYGYFSITRIKKLTITEASTIISVGFAIIHSILGGHVIYEALTGTYFGIILALVGNEEDK